MDIAIYVALGAILALLASLLARRFVGFAAQSPDDYAGQGPEFDIRRQYMLDRFQKIKNIRVCEPDGAFYFLVDTSKTEIKSVNLAEKLLSMVDERSRRVEILAEIVPGLPVEPEGVVTGEEIRRS